MHYVALGNQSVTLITGVASSAVAIIAIAFAWWTTHVTLRQQRTLASDDRKWQEQRIAYQEIAEWLAANHLLGADEPFYEHDIFAAWTSSPGIELEAKARLFTTEPVITMLTKLRAQATMEKAMAHAAKLAITYATEGNTPFADSQIAKACNWSSPKDASRYLTELRGAWNTARNDLEKALREVYRPPAPAISPTTRP